MLDLEERKGYFRGMVSILRLVLFLIVLLVLFGHVLSFAVWQYRNPKANAMTFYSHYSDVVHWRTLSDFQ